MSRVITFAFFMLMGGLVSILIATGCALFVDYDGMRLRPLTDARDRRMRQLWIERGPAHFPSQFIIVDSMERYGTGLSLDWIGEKDPALEHSLVRYRAGWPWPCLEGFMWRTQTYAPDPTLPGNRLMITGNSIVNDKLALVRRDRVRIITLERSKMLPYGPIYKGLILNSLFYGFVLLLLWKIFRGWRRSRLRRAGRCPACGYQLKGLPRCPECGEVSSPVETA